MKSTALSQQFAVFTLIALDPGKKDIIFQFAPPEIGKELNIGTQENSGSNDPDSGRPKVSFKSKEATKLSFSTVFDTVEENESVYDKYIKDIEDGTTFIPKMKRPGIYRCTYGETLLARCFITKASYKFTMFDPNGTPTRAVVNIDLKEADEPTAADKTSAGAPNPGTSARTNPQQGSFAASLFSPLLDFFS